MLDIPQILSRAVADFPQHLGQRSLKRLRSYLVGYGNACCDLQIPYPYDPVDGQLGDWVENRIKLTPEHESRLNARAGFNPYSYARLISQDESHALDTFLELRELALRDLGATPRTEAISSPSGHKNAFDLLPDMQKRPGLYLGNDWHLSNLWAYYRGYIWCEKDNGIHESETSTILTGFQEWMEQRYPFAAGITWDRILLFIKVESSRWALQSFTEHLALYLDGEVPDTMDTTMKIILSNIMDKLDKQ